MGASGWTGTGQPCRLEMHGVATDVLNSFFFSGKIVLPVQEISETSWAFLFNLELRFVSFILRVTTTHVSYRDP